MMVDKSTQQDEQIREVFSDIGKITPKEDFTMNVMTKIEKEIIPVHIQYTPIINKSGWGFIAAVVLALFFFILYMSPESTGILSSLSFQIDLSPFSSFIQLLYTQVAEFLFSSEIVLSLIAIAALGLINFMIFQRINPVKV